MIHSKTKCRRVGCGHTYKRHAEDDYTIPPARGCYETGCECRAFIGPADVAKPLRKAPSSAEAMTAEAYSAGIREAAPNQPFSIVGQRIGSIVGPVARQHAPGLKGAEFYVWLRESAREFRRATAHEPQFWGGWQPYNWAKWMNMGRKVGGTKPSLLQPAPAVTIRSIGRRT